MARGDAQTSPWPWETSDYMGRRITISLPFNESTGAILDGTVIHRDEGCVLSRIVWDDPTDNVKRKVSPTVPVGDTTLTAPQVRQATGFRNLADVLAVQITAE